MLSDGTGHLCGYVLSRSFLPGMDGVFVGSFMKIGMESQCIFFLLTFRDSVRQDVRNHQASCSRFVCDAESALELTSQEVVTMHRMQKEVRTVVKTWCHCVLDVGVLISANVAPRRTAVYNFSVRVGSSTRRSRNSWSHDKKSSRLGCGVPLRLLQTAEKS